MSLDYWNQSLGIDPGQVFNSLLSPAGIVNQFALSLAIQAESPGTS